MVAANSLVRATIFGRAAHRLDTTAGHVLGKVSVALYHLGNFGRRLADPCRH